MSKLGFTMSIIEWIMKKLSGGSTAPDAALTDEQMIRKNIQAIGLHHFPDDEDATWNIDSISFENGMFVVDTSPVPHVGYERIRFYMRNPSIDGVASADCWDNGEWSGLFSS